jgi:hypothetical protein
MLGCRARRVAVTALSLLWVLVVGAASPAQAAEKAIWGPTTLPDGSSAFALYDELGIDTLQLTLRWDEVAGQRPAAPSDPADAAYRWPGEIAAAASEAARRGIRLSLLVTGAPGWANGGRASIWLPARAQDLGDFLIAATRRYPTVRRWMIWGEPNRDDRFQPNTRNGAIGPRAYAVLLDAAYVALKRASRHNIVIGANTWTGGTVRPADFLRLMRLPNGRRPRLDWLGHNPFPFRFPRLAEKPLAGGYRDISDIDTISRDARRSYGRRIPLWLSEYTIQSERGSDSFATFVSPVEQARFLTAGYALADELGPDVAGLGWLGLLDEPPAPPASANWGLLTHALERKPAFAAMRRAPSERLRPAVTAPAAISRARLRRSAGLKVTVTPRAAGTVVVELRRGSTVRDRVRVTGRAGRRVTATLRSSLATAGPHVVRVRAARAATVRRAVRVR